MNIWLRFIPVMLIQFSLAGLGSLIVICYRKEELKEYGLVKNNFFKTIILSLVVCIPSMIFLLVNNEINSYLPLKGCFFTSLFLNSNYPTNILGYILIAFVWGIVEGFNYVVIYKKIKLIFFKILCSLKFFCTSSNFIILPPHLYLSTVYLYLNTNSFIDILSGIRKVALIL